MIKLDIPEILETGQHVRNLRMKLSWTYSKLMMLIVIICLMLHIQVTTKGFGPISKIFDMTSNIASYFPNK